MKRIAHITEGVTIMTPEGAAKLLRGQTAMIYRNGKVLQDVVLSRRAAQVYITDPDSPERATRWLAPVGEERLVRPCDAEGSLELSAPSFAAVTRVGHDVPVFGAFERATLSGKLTASWRPLAAGEVMSGIDLNHTADPEGTSILTPALGFMEEGVGNYDIVTGKLGWFCPHLPVTAGVAGALALPDTIAHTSAVMELIADGRPIHIGWAVLGGDSSLVRLVDETPRRAVGLQEDWGLYARNKSVGLAARMASELDAPQLLAAVTTPPNSWNESVQAWAQTLDGISAMEMFEEQETELHMNIARAFAPVVWSATGHLDDLDQVDRESARQVRELLMDLVAP